MIYKFGCFNCGEESDQEISTSASHIVCPFCKTHNSTVALLADDVANLKGKIQDEYLKNTRLSNRFYDMEEQIKLLKEALEFYADKENYVERGGDRTEIMSKDYDEVAQFTGFIYLAGKRAREALKKLEEMESK